MMYPIRIGITGGIGSGKSYVARLWQQRHHLPLYDCDTRARALMTSDAQLRSALQALIGEDAYTPDGQLCRSRVAEFLFANSDNARRINAIVHPAVRRDWLRFAAETQAPAVLMESAILIEAGMSDTVDAIVLVEAPEELRINRAMQRDGSTRQQVRARVAQQSPQDSLRQMAQYIITNDGQPLEEQIDTIHHLIINTNNQ